MVRLEILLVGVLATGVIDNYSSNSQIRAEDRLDHQQDFFNAIRTNNLSAVQHYLGQDQTLLTRVDREGNLPLHYAVRQRQERVIDYLVRQGAALASSSVIPEKIKQKIRGVSWKERCPVPLKDLRYVQFVHWGFDDKRHIGELVVHKDAAPLLASTILVDLYHAHYPIEKAVLIDVYEGNDDRSMDDNNTSAFNCRRITGGRRFSEHSYGKALDINPRVNPYVKGKRVLPPSGKPFVRRNPAVKGLITKGDAVYTAFTQRGWKWGGDWRSPKDYQHFELPRE